MSGGIRVVAIYAKALNEMGHDVLLVSPPPKNIPLIRNIKSLLKGRGWKKPIVKKSHVDNLGIEHRILERYRPVIDKDVDNADIIIATWWETTEWVMNLSSDKGAKVYFIQHHEVHSYLPIKRSMASYKLPFHKIVVARWLETIMNEDYGDAVVDLVSNSVDHDLFFSSHRHKQKKPTVGFLYSKSSYKGVDITLQVIKKLRQKFPKLRVITFGAVEPNNEIDTNIEFHFSPEQSHIRELYAQCDIWITASITEGFNLPAMEAMACGTPVVSTKAGWPEEAIQNMKNGYLTAVGDVDALTDAAIAILSLSDKKWKCMSDNAIETTKDSSWEESSKLFEKALLHACERSRKGEIEGHCSDSLELPKSG